MTPMDYPEKKREAYLNEDLVLSRRVRSSFDGIPTKKLYPAGTRLYRLGTHYRKDGNHDGNPTLEGAFWLPEKEYRRLINEARDGDRPLTHAVRRQYAIKPDWNPKLDNVTEVRLKKPVYGFEGRTAGQIVAGTINPQSRAALEGGALQVFLPGLDPQAGTRTGTTKRALEKLAGPSSPYADVLTYQPDINSKLDPPKPAEAPKRDRRTLFRKLAALDERKRTPGP
jgi:hypothetical protein